MYDFKRFKDGIILSVRVKPNSSKFFLEVKDKIIIHCKSPARENKANLEIIKELKRMLKKDVEIKSGFKSKEKRIMIHNITDEELKEWISKL